MGTGWLTFDKCAVRTTLQSEITKSGTGKVMAINCRGRFAQGTIVNFTL
jgi:hypothetical protein